MRHLAPIFATFVFGTACGTSSSSDPVDTGGSGGRDAGTADASQPGSPDVGLADAGQPDQGVSDDTLVERVGAEGGAIETEGVSLSIPAGALTEDVDITLRVLEPGEVPDAERITGPAVSLGPDGQTFAVPVILRLEDPGPAPEGFRKAVLRLNEVTMEWAPVSESTREGNVTVGQLSSFSEYGSGLVPLGGGNLMEGAFGCEVDGDCAGDLRCGIDFGAKFTGMEGNVCVQPHCVNEIRDELEAGVDCGGDDTCGSCRLFFASATGDVRYDAFPIGVGSTPLVDLAPDEFGGVYGLFESGFIIQLDEDGNVIRDEFFIPPENSIEPFRRIELDHENNIILVDNRNLYKFDSNGSIIWGRAITGSPVEIRDIDFDCESNLLAVGYYGGAVQVGERESLPDLGINAGFILKIAPNGDILHVQGFADMHMEQVVSKTYGQPFIATCDYYVAGFASEKADVNFTDDPANELTGSGGLLADAPIARFDANDQHVYSFRNGGSATYRFDGSRPIVDITMRDFNPVMYGAGRAFFEGGRGVVNGAFWGTNIDRRDGSSGISFDIGGGVSPGQDRSAAATVAFETLAGPQFAVGTVNGVRAIGFLTNKPAIGEELKSTAFLTSSTGWTQTFTYTAGGSLDRNLPFVMAITAKGRPVFGGNLPTQPGWSVEWADGTFEATDLVGNNAAYIVGFEP